jgi:hypothetical protein
MKLRILFCLAFFLSGCSAMGVVETNDPNEKLIQASHLMANGRPIPAERIALEALQIFQGKQDAMGLGEANLFLGQFYKAKSGWGNVNKDEFLDKSIEYINSSIDSFLSIQENMQASKAVFELAQSYRGKEQTIEMCSNFQRSLELYRSGVGTVKSFQYNKQFGSVSGLIEAHVEQLCTNV